MLLTLLRSYIVWLLIAFGGGLIGTLLVLVLDHSQARAFFISYIYHWDGLIVATSGYGALHFGLSTYRQQFNYLVSTILCFKNGKDVEVYFGLENLFSLRNKQWLALPVLIVGASVLFICGYPMTGFPHYLLWISSSMMFYAGGLMLSFGIYSIRFFSTLERNIDDIELQDNVHILELENFNLYLSTLFLVTTIALYFAFRGTLTANFTFIPPAPWIDHLVRLFMSPQDDYKVVRSLLIYPIVLFLPIAAFAGFYVRLVLRKIYLTSIKRKILEIDELAKPVLESGASSYPIDRIIEIRKSAMELKEKILSNNKVLPLIDLKDSPSIVLLLIIFIQFIVENDATIRGFFKSLLGLST
jgi:hypothetical protein